MFLFSPNKMSSLKSMLRHELDRINNIYWCNYNCDKRATVKVMSEISKYLSSMINVLSFFFHEISFQHFDSRRDEDLIILINTDRNVRTVLLNNIRITLFGYVAECWWMRARETYTEILRQAWTEKYGARGHGSMAHGRIQRIEVADDYNTRIPSYHSRPVHPAQCVGAHRWV